MSYGRKRVQLSTVEVESVEPSRVEVVQIEALALLKIISHSGDALPDMVEGTLVGAVRGNVLEITNCFAQPSREVTAEGDEPDPGSVDKYVRWHRVNTLHAFRLMNLDYVFLGTYRSAVLGSDSSKELAQSEWKSIRTQLDVQREWGPNTIVLVYDPVGSSRGRLVLRALRLTSTFLRAYEDSRGAIEGRNGVPITWSSVFEELPVRVRNGKLMSSVVLDVDAGLRSSADDVVGRGVAPGRAGAAGAGGLAAGAGAGAGAGGVAAVAGAGAAAAGGGGAGEFERLDLSVAPYLEKHLTFLVEQVPEYVQLHARTADTERKSAERRQQREKFIEQRKEENRAREREGQPLLPLEDPSADPAAFADISHEEREDRLRSLLLASSVARHCRDIGAVTADSFGKLFLASALRK